MKAAVVVVMAACVAVLGVVGARTFAQTPPPPVPTVTAMPPGPVPVPPPTTPAPVAQPAAPTGPSRAIGQPWHGRLVNGAQLPEVSGDWLTWDPVLKQIPNRPERRWGTAKLIATIKRVLASWHLAHPEMPQLLIGDLSRPHGGVFDQRYGGLGHASHQNGLDADIYYPRLDRHLRAPIATSQIDRPAIIHNAFLDWRQGTRSGANAARPRSISLEPPKRLPRHGLAPVLRPCGGADRRAPQER